MISSFRDNLDWLSRATNGAKLSATATLGVIHRGHEKDTAGTSFGYAEGGGLCALGLIHANHGGEITEYLPWPGEGGHQRDDQARGLPGPGPGLHGDPQG